jgi:hypothetical protein
MEGEARLLISEKTLILLVFFASQEKTLILYICHNSCRLVH